MNTPLALRLIARVRAHIAEPIAGGAVPGGGRRIIPITAGVVDGPDLFGEVVALGADWNMVRADGAETVSARYLLRTHDDVVLSVTNEGVLTPGPDGTFGITSLRIEAPVDGTYAWLNDAVLVGSLEAVVEDGAVVGVSLEYWCVQRRLG